MSDHDGPDSDRDGGRHGRVPVSALLRIATRAESTLPAMGPGTNTNSPRFNSIIATPEERSLISSNFQVGGASKDNRIQTQRKL